MKIENQELVVTVGGEEKRHPLPEVRSDAVVRAWAVPEEYRPGGVFVAVTERGAEQEFPACSQRDAVYLGEIEHLATAAAKLAAAKEALMSAATAHRWVVMTSGLVLPGGMRAGTTIDDQNRITSVVANAGLAGLQDTDEVDFKAESGWTRITVGQIKALAGAIGQFVQGCYTAEKTHHDAISALPDIATVDQYDVTVGWPANEQ